MTKKRKVRYDRVAILVVLIVLILAALFYLGRLLFKKDDPTPKPKPDDPSGEVTPSDKDESKISFELLEYEVYEDSEQKLGFNFVIAKVKAKDEGVIKYDLSNLETSEKIKLSDYQKYFDKIKKESYSLDKKEIDTLVRSDEKEATFTLFIPYKSTKDTLYVYELLNNGMLKINVKENHKDLSELKVESDGNVVDDEGKYDISVSDSFISTMMYENGNPYSVSSSCSVYTFRLKVNAAQYGVTIEDAQFVQTSSGAVYDALGRKFESAKLGNIIGEPLAEVDQSMALFFEVYEESGDRDYKGTLRIKFSGDDTWFELPTELR